MGVRCEFEWDYAKAEAREEAHEKGMEQSPS
jgi:hypothetical protein